MQTLIEELLKKNIRNSDVAKILNINIQEVINHKSRMFTPKRDKRTYNIAYNKAIFKVREISGLNDSLARKIVKEIKSIYKID